VTSFLLGSLSTLVSVGLGLWAGFFKKAQEDKVRRASIATALLAELRPLERMLRVRAAHVRAAESTVVIGMPVYDRFESDILLFPAETAHLLLELRSFVRDIENTAEYFAGGKNVPDQKAHHYMRSKAAFAANLVPRIKRVLQEAGGLSPADPPVEVYESGELPALLPPAFPNAAALPVSIAGVTQPS